MIVACIVVALGRPAVLPAQVTDDVGAFDLIQLERPRILEKAERYLEQAPRTVTADSCDRSAGGPHDYYSEGDYDFSI